MSNFSKIRETINAKLDDLEKKTEFDQQDVRAIAKIAGLYKKINI